MTPKHIKTTHAQRAAIITFTPNGGPVSGFKKRLTNKKCKTNPIPNLRTTNHHLRTNLNKQTQFPFSGIDVRSCKKCTYGKPTSMCTRKTNPNEPNYHPQNGPIMSSRAQECEAKRSVPQPKDLFIEHREAIPYINAKQTQFTGQRTMNYQLPTVFEKTNPIPKSPHPAPGCGDMLTTTKNRCAKKTQKPGKFAKNQKKPNFFKKNQKKHKKKQSQFPSPTANRQKPTAQFYKTNPILTKP